MLDEQAYLDKLHALPEEERLALLRGRFDLTAVDPASFLGEVNKLDAEIQKMPGALTGKDTEQICPVRHIFKDGYYTRVLQSPANALVITKTHIYEHPWVLLAGELTIVDKDGARRLKAPATGITSPGTKRVIYTHTPVVFVTHHKTLETEVDAAEAMIFQEDRDALTRPTLHIEEIQG